MSDAFDPDAVADALIKAVEGNPLWPHLKSSGDLIDKLAGRIVTLEARLAEALRLIEKHQYVRIGYDASGACPECIEHLEHSPTCTIAAVLKGDELCISLNGLRAITAAKLSAGAASPHIAEDVFSVTVLCRFTNTGQVKPRYGAARACGE